MKAIETVYHGYKFRSRLEARWAVFFDTLDIAYEYEKEGFDLDDAGWYLPDFWLPAFNCWIEIKANTPTKEEYQKAKYLTIATQHSTFIYSGMPDVMTHIFEAFPWRDDDIVLNVFFNRAKPHLEIPDELILPSFIPSDQDRIIAGRNTRLHIGWAYSTTPFHECHVCHQLRPNRFAYTFCNCEWNPTQSSYYVLRDDDQSPRLIMAYAAARQARFEHGMRGLV